MCNQKKRLRKNRKRIIHKEEDADMPETNTFGASERSHICLLAKLIVNEFFFFSLSSET